MMGETARLFLGLELNDEARDALHSARKEMEALGAMGKFHAPALYHLTLVFLGSTPSEKIPLIKRLMDGVPSEPFTLTLAAPGTFKNGSILWAGVQPCDPLMTYQAKLSRALRESHFIIEEGEYRPHITLARQVKTSVPSIKIPPIVFPVRHATLFESTRVDGALTYLPLYRSVFH